MTTYYIVESNVFVATTAPIYWINTSTAYAPTRSTRRLRELELLAMMPAPQPDIKLAQLPSAPERHAAWRRRALPRRPS